MMKKLTRCILVAAVPAGIFYSLSLLVLKLSGFGIMEILRDPAQQSGESSFLGFISNIGIWLWISSAAIAFFSARTQKSDSTWERKELLILVGTFSLILAVDDFFMIHDRYIHQYICYAAYAICAGALLIRHYQTILGINGVAFLLAGSLLALSIMTDVVQSYIPAPYAVVQIFEEGFKFVGAAIWLHFCSQAATYTPSMQKQIL